VAGVTRVKREGDGVRAWYSLARLLKRMSDGGATIHGFQKQCGGSHAPDSSIARCTRPIRRSSFRFWAKEKLLTRRLKIGARSFHRIGRPIVRAPATKPPRRRAA
jgi:hypothetical protein